MKKIISLLVIFITLLCGITNSYAISWASVEKMSEDDEPMLPRFGEFASQGYIFEMNGKTYIIGNRSSRYSLPLETESLFPESEYILAGNIYMLRNPAFDEIWDVRGVSKVPVKFANKELEILSTHYFDSSVCAIGYFAGTYYCQVFGTKQVYKSTDMENWEETSESVPRQTKQLTYSEDSISFDGINMIVVDYEDNVYREFWSTMGDWILKVDADYNFYLSNDNIYFTKIDMPQEWLQYDLFLYDLKCIYEYDNDIVVDLKKPIGRGREGLRFRIQKQSVYNQLEQQERAPYVKYNNTILGFEQPPIIQNDRTLIPIRFLFEQMGAEVTWNGEEQTATISQDNTAITFAIDDTEADVNGQTVSMEIPAQLINDKTMVPVRFLSEALGYTVNWDGDTRIITIE